LQWLSQLAETGLTEIKKLEFEFFSKLNCTVFHKVGNVHAYIHRDTLNDSAQRRRFNLFLSHDPASRENGLFFGIMDTSIFDGPLSDRIMTGMSIVAARNSGASVLVSQSRTFVSEMTDLNKLLNTESTAKTRIIKDLVQYNSFVDPGVMVLEWDVKAPKVFSD
jgi:hypothetical protein